MINFGSYVNTDTEKQSSLEHFASLVFYDSKFFREVFNGQGIICECEIVDDTDNNSDPVGRITHFDYWECNLPITYYDLKLYQNIISQTKDEFGYFFVISYDTTVNPFATMWKLFYYYDEELGRKQYHDRR